jgi:hypothetical protein
MRAAAGQINETGSYYALYCSLEELRATTDKNEAKITLLDLLNDALENSEVEALNRNASGDFLARVESRSGFRSSPLKVWLRVLCSRIDKDLVVFFDEIDSLNFEILLSFLSQLRVGYVERADIPFPRSVALIGMSNIRDYKDRLRPESKSMGSASPFNIITEALTLSNFSPDEVRTLYAQHTEATGQIFLDEAVKNAWRWSEGQPWLVNALAAEVIEEILDFDYGRTVDEELIDQAAGNLMKRRDTHIDSLLARLEEPRVVRILDDVIAATEKPDIFSQSEENKAADAAGAESFNDDLQYCVDLGLIKDDEAKGILRPANPIYASVIVRSINYKIEKRLPKELINKWTDGKKLDLTGLLKEFQRTWANDAEKYLHGVKYIEAGPHLFLSSFLQRSLNGVAIVSESYASGMGYADIVVQHAGQKHPVELKIKDNERSRAKSVNQILKYMDRLLAKEGWLVIIDRNPEKKAMEKISWNTTVTPEGCTIHIIGC